MKKKRILMKKTKKKNAITLLALVITIVIMLLLAAIVIQMALGENGLVIKSIQARKEQGKAELYETVKLSYINLKSKALYPFSSKSPIVYVFPRLLLIFPPSTCRNSECIQYLAGFLPHSPLLCAISFS